MTVAISMRSFQKFWFLLHGSVCRLWWSIQKGKKISRTISLIWPTNLVNYQTLIADSMTKTHTDKPPRFCNKTSSSFSSYLIDPESITATLYNMSSGLRFRKFDKTSIASMPLASILHSRGGHSRSLGSANLVVAYFICVRYSFCTRICHDAFALSALSCCRRRLPAYHRDRQPRRNEPKVMTPSQHVLIFFYSVYVQSCRVQSQ